MKYADFNFEHCLYRSLAHPNEENLGRWSKTIYILFKDGFAIRDYRYRRDVLFMGITIKIELKVNMMNTGYGKFSKPGGSLFPQVF